MTTVLSQTKDAVKIADSLKVSKLESSIVKVHSIEVTKQYQIRLSFSRFDIVISEHSLADDFIYSLSDNRVVKSNSTVGYGVVQNRESFQFEPAFSEINSKIVSTISKHYDPKELNIDAICVGFGVAKFRFSYNPEIEKEQNNKFFTNTDSKILNIYLGIKDLYLSVSKDKNIDLIYPTDVIIQ